MLKENFEQNIKVRYTIIRLFRLGPIGGELCSCDGRL